MNEKDLAQVLAWRNHLDVRRYMYSTHEISIQEHQSWYEKARNNNALNLLIYEQRGQALGFVRFSRSSCPEVADWGFYLAPDAPPGSGGMLGELALEYGFSVLKLHKLCGQALAFNERSIRFHLRLAFREEGRLREQHFDGIEFHDVVCFGLLKQEWKASSGDKS